MRVLVECTDALKEDQRKLADEISQIFSLAANSYKTGSHWLIGIARN